MPVVNGLFEYGEAKVGALIVIEHKRSFRRVVRTGELIDAAINQRLFENIFL
jgi:DNA integrity scanning protein DisA with diadenylate cyclase activity